MMGTKVRTTTNSATTLVTGRCRGRTSEEKIQIGRVCCWPAVKVVTMISSKERAKASMPPVTNAEASWGSITYRKVCHPRAPKSMDASSNEGAVLRIRAMTLLKATATQKVACPMTTVQNENGIPDRLMADRNAIPVMMPGRAIGKTMKSERVSRPKNFDLHTAPAARVPRTKAITVATAATPSDSDSASRTSGLRAATPNHWVVSPGGGNRKLASSVVKAYRNTRRRGGGKKSSTAPPTNSRIRGLLIAPRRPRAVEPG